MQRRKGVLAQSDEETASFLEVDNTTNSAAAAPNVLSIGRRQWRLNNWFYLARRIIFLFVGGCSIFFLVIVVFVNHGHHLTCRIHGALCTPFRAYVARFPMLPQRKSSTESILVGEQLATQISCSRFDEFLSLYHPPSSRRTLFLIGESRGGSTYTYDTLNLHPSIEMVGGEALFGFSIEVCNNNELLLRNHKECTFENWLRSLYENAYHRRLQSKLLVGTKINIEQIPPEFYADLASFLSCIREKSVILHVTRASAIASFLNYQAEVPERIHASNWNFNSNNLAKGLETPLELDPELAAEWVHTRDGLSQDLFRILSFGAPAPLLYQRVYYEHLKDPIVGDQYWKSVFAFLGVDSSVSVKALRASQDRNADLRTHNKTHGSTLCSQRIANWEKVKEALGPDSLSSLVCESHSR